jgi:hypothetical protein
MEEAGAQPPSTTPSSGGTLPLPVAPISVAADVGTEHLDGAADHERARGLGYTEFEHELEDRFDGLNLCGEEETDLDFSCETDDLVGVHWLAIFRVYTTKPFRHATKFNQMRNAWAAAQDVTLVGKAL